MNPTVFTIATGAVPVYGLYSIHVFRSGVGTADLQCSHFPSDANSWFTLPSTLGLVYALAGSVKLVGTDTNAKCSMVRMPDGAGC